MVNLRLVALGGMEVKMSLEGGRDSCFSSLCLLLFLESKA